MLAVLACSASAFGQAPQSRSKFVPRYDAQPTQAVVPVQATTPRADTSARTALDRQYESYLRLDPPGRERLFGQLDSERQVEERMRQERRDAGGAETLGPVTFPENERIQSTKEAYQPRQFPPTAVLVEPSYVVYRRLYFEEKNAERYGWDLGPIQPVVSSLHFFKDLVLWPANFGAYPCRRFETSAGQCWPGDPVPYFIYPPEITRTGLLAQAGAIGLLVAVLP